MLIKLTRTQYGVIYREHSSINVVSELSSSRATIDGTEYQESAEAIAKAVNAAYLMTCGTPEARASAHKQASNDPGLAGMLPMAFLVGMALSG